MIMLYKLTVAFVGAFALFVAVAVVLSPTTEVAGKVVSFVQQKTGACFTSSILSPNELRAMADDLDSLSKIGG
jgi:hypothetical protein